MRHQNASLSLEVVRVYCSASFLHGDDVDKMLTPTRADGDGRHGAHFLHNAMSTASCTYFAQRDVVQNYCTCYFCWLATTDCAVIVHEIDR